MIVVAPEAGLGNRLRVLCSFLVLARRLDRPFALCWATGTGWSDEDLSDLFTNEFDRVSPEAFDDLRTGALQIDQSVSLAPGDQPDRSTWLDGRHFLDLFDQTRYPVVTYRGAHAVQTLVPRGVLERQFPSYRIEMARAARDLTPVPEIEAAVERLVGRFGDHTVGVHIRRGDAFQSRSLRHHFERSSDRAFTSAMYQELERDPDVRFFLATDDQETESRFRERFGDACITNPDKTFVASRIGQPKENQRDAVIDMFALARTSRILGNYFSSFSKVAALVGGIGWQAVVEDEQPGIAGMLPASRPVRTRDTVASFSVNGVGLGHASRLVAIHNELRGEGVLGSVFFVRHEMDLIAEYRFPQTVLPRYPGYLMEPTGVGFSGSPAHDVAQAVVEMTLRGMAPIVLHDVFIHRAVYEVAVAAGWPQALVYRDRLGIGGPGEFLRLVAPAVSVAFFLGHPGYEEESRDLHVIGVEDVVRPQLGRESLWTETDEGEVRILVTAGGGGHKPAADFLNAAVAAVDIVGKRCQRPVRARIVTGPYFAGDVHVPPSPQADLTVTRYVPQTHSMYADATVVVAQAGYNTVQELEAAGIPCVLVPLPASTGFDDQQARAMARQDSDGVYVADPDPDDIASGILAVLDTSLTPAMLDTGPGQRGAAQIATMLEVLSGA